VQFFYNAGMQALSRNDAVFVHVKISGKPTKEDKALMRKYRVRRLGTAVLADHDGNPLAHAEVKLSTKLMKQIRTAREVIRKAAQDIEERMEKAKAALEKGNRNSAEVYYKSIIRKYPTYEQAGTAEECLEKMRKGEEEAAEEKKEPGKEAEQGEDEKAEPAA
jgi:hypothetical protein